MENKNLENAVKKEGKYNGIILLGNGIFGALSGLSTGYLIYKLEQPNPTVFLEVIGALAGYTAGVYLYKNVAGKLYKPYIEHYERFLNEPDHYF